ncbi:uncharacterized protein PG998_011451 [Apiospora kogelbergensis]|uniref:uncharacterized protein n=1 Tax=Apiospora kogelbergensis TaxID=1337665 RepID=UPI00312DAC6C
MGVWNRGSRGGGGGGKTATTPKSYFLLLPPEIRHMIYDLLLGEPGIIEPEAHDRLVGWGPRPESWKATHRHIRSDSDPPSKILTAMVMHSQGRWHRSPRNVQLFSPRWPRRPPLSTDPYCWHSKHQLVCSDGDMLPLPTTQGPHYLNLMRTCRAVYSELLDRLYGANTISLCGADMVDVAAREWPRAGLARVAYVHVALIVNTERGWKSDLAWNRRRWRRELEKTARTLAGAFPAMRQLDLEIAAPGEDLFLKSHHKALWRDLCEVLDKYLTASSTTKTANREWWRRKKRPRPPLEEFVLKVPICIWREPDEAGRQKCGNCLLSSWNECDYQRLKAAICGKETTRSA